MRNDILLIKFQIIFLNLIFLFEIFFPRAFRSSMIFIIFPLQVVPKKEGCCVRRRHMSNGAHFYRRTCSYIRVCTFRHRMFGFLFSSASKVNWTTAILRHTHTCKLSNSQRIFRNVFLYTFLLNIDISTIHIWVWIEMGTSQDYEQGSM